jgi:hypothetical protein
MTASRLAKAFLRWKDFDPKRQKMMKATTQKARGAKKIAPPM